jgi:hypothetical protein
MISRLTILLVYLAVLSSCSKSVDEEGSGTSQSSSFKLLLTVPGAQKLYTVGDLAMVGDRSYIAAISDQAGITSSPFLFQSNNEWRVYEQENQRFVALTTHNGTLYGIMQYIQPYQSGQLTSYRFSYYLYKWANSSFENIAMYEYTDQNHVEKSPLQSLQFLKWQGVLKLVGKTSTGVALLWNLSNDKFLLEREIGDVGRSVHIIPDANGICFTSYYQINQTFDRFDYTQWHYYDGQTLEAGQVHKFQETLDGSFDNTYGNYFALQKTMYGFRKGEFRNIDKDETIKKQPEKLTYQVASVRSANGKIYAIVGWGDGDCRKLAVFDGRNYKEYDFTLPANIDPCSRLLDVEELDGKMYLLLSTNRQLAIVYRTI